MRERFLSRSFLKRREERARNSSSVYSLPAFCQAVRARACVRHRVLQGVSRMTAALFWSRYALKFKV
jgi:hypothetical protein